jgi:hypothetical protein
MHTHTLDNIACRWAMVMLDKGSTLTDSDMSPMCVSCRCAMAKLEKGSTLTDSDTSPMCVSAAFGNWHCRILLVFQSKEPSPDGFQIVCEIADQGHVDGVVKRPIEEGLEEVEHSRSKQVFLDEKVPLLIDVKVSRSTTQHRFAFLAASTENSISFTMTASGYIRFTRGGEVIHRVHVELPR